MRRAKLLLLTTLLLASCGRDALHATAALTCSSMSSSIMPLCDGNGTTTPGVTITTSSAWLVDQRTLHPFCGNGSYSWNSGGSRESWIRVAFTTPEARPLASYHLASFEWVIGGVGCSASHCVVSREFTFTGQRTSTSAYETIGSKIVSVGPNGHSNTETQHSFVFSDTKTSWHSVKITMKNLSGKTSIWIAVRQAALCGIPTGVRIAEVIGLGVPGVNRLWPSETFVMGSGQKLPFSVSLRISESLTSVFANHSFCLTEVIVLSDWHAKRPTSIVVTTNAPVSNRSHSITIGSSQWQEHNGYVCGVNGDEACTVSTGPSLLRTPIFNCPDINDDNMLYVTIDGLLSAANRYVVIDGVQAFGGVNARRQENTVPEEVESVPEEVESVTEEGRSGSVSDVDGSNGLESTQSGSGTTNIIIYLASGASVLICVAFAFGMQWGRSRARRTQKIYDDQQVKADVHAIANVGTKADDVPHHNGNELYLGTLPTPLPTPSAPPFMPTPTAPGATPLPSGIAASHELPPLPTYSDVMRCPSYSS